MKVFPYYVTETGQSLILNAIERLISADDFSNFNNLSTGYYLISYIVNSIRLPNLQHTSIVSHCLFIRNLVKILHS